MTGKQKNMTVFFGLFVIAAAALFCFFILVKDKQGVSKMDVIEAKRTVQKFIDAHNSADLEKCIYYTAAPIQGAYDNHSVPEDNIFAYDYHIDGLIYDPDSVLYSVSKELFNQHNIQSGDGIYLYANFTPSLKDGNESAVWNSGEAYDYFGFWLIKADGEWKLMDWGM